MKRSNKKKIQYSLACIAAITIGLFFIARPLENKTSSALSGKIQTVLDTYAEGFYTVENPIQIENSISMVAKFFNVKTADRAEAQACLIRIMGITGPVTAIFIHEHNETQFIGITGYRNIQDTNNRGITDNQISYWKNNISKVLTEHFAIEEQNNDA